MATLTEALGAQSIPQIDAGTKTMEGMKTAMNLAEQAQGLEANKVKVAEMKDQMETAQYNKALNSLHTLARTRPEIAKKMVGKVKENLNRAGIAVDDLVLDQFVSDDAFRQRMLSGYNYLAGKATDPGERSKGMQALADWGLFEKVFIGADAEQQNERLKSQEKIASLKLKADIAADDRQRVRDEDRQAKIDERQQKGIDEQRDREFRNDATELSKRIVKDVGPDILATIGDIDKYVGGIYSDEAIKKYDKIAGVEGLVAGLRVPFTDIKPFEKNFKGKDLELFQNIASLQNTYLKLRSGANVTDGEAEKFLKELGAGGIRSGEQLRNGVRGLTRGVAAQLKAVESGYDPRVISMYRDRPGAITSDQIPVQSSAQRASPMDAIQRAGQAPAKAPQSPQNLNEIIKAAAQRGRAQKASPEVVQSALEQKIGRKLTADELAIIKNSNTGGM